MRQFSAQMGMSKWRPWGQKATCSRCIGGISAAIGLLSPKCPLCWIAIFGMSAGFAKGLLLVELASVLSYGYSLWRILRTQGFSVSYSVSICCALTSALSSGVWFVPDKEVRSLLLATFLLVTFFFFHRLRHGRTTLNR